MWYRNLYIGATCHSQFVCPKQGRRRYSCVWLGVVLLWQSGSGAECTVLSAVLTVRGPHAVRRQPLLQSGRPSVLFDWVQRRSR